MRNNVARKNIEELREEIERREFHNSQIILSEITSQVKKNFFNDENCKYNSQTTDMTQNLIDLDQNFSLIL